MFDIALRSYKDLLFDPVSRSVPAAVTPIRITAIAFICGLSCCALASAGFRYLSLFFWLLNRSLDCLDGAVARHRRQQSDLGGFLDLLCDFIVYALIPICCSCAHAYGASTSWQATELLLVALLEASFFINNFILFYIAALIEKGQREGLERQTNEVTSLAMRPALIEGFESGVFFTVMLAVPTMVGPFAALMFIGVTVGIAQRTWWLATALSPVDKKAS
jgi:phosphatidylglycerophosphate synthase